MPLRTPLLALLLLPAIFACSGISAPDGDDDPLTLVFFAASSTTEAVEELSAAFSESAGIRVRALEAGSTFLAEQVAEGHMADVFLSADSENVETLKEKSLVEAHRPLLGNRMVLVALQDSPLVLDRLELLSQRTFGTLAIAAPDEAPAGAYARRALRDAGIWQDIRGRMIHTGDVREAMFYVERGEVDTAIVYVTDLARSDRLRAVLDVGTDRTGPIVYHLALLRRDTPRPAARRLYEFLQSPEAIAVFERYGFEIVESP